MKKNGLKLIATGIALSTEDRKRHVAMLNNMIDSIGDSIRSSSDIDGMPHGTSVGDAVGSKVVKIEAVKRERDIEQERINAYDWAMENALNLVDEKYHDIMSKAIMMSLNNKMSNVVALLSDTPIHISTFYACRGTFLSQILKYLHFNLS